MLAPIVIFAFNRPESLRRLIDSISQSKLYEESDKFVYVDGPRNEEEKVLVDQTIAIAKSITDNVIVSETNKGLGNSIIGGISEVIERYGRVIVLEDDLWCAPGFLEYMNNGLEYLGDDERICSICGYGLKIKVPKDYKEEVYLSNRSSSWGWGTWKDRWKQVDWEVGDYDTFINDKKKVKSFNKGGSDMASMLRGYMEGKNRSWAIRFCYWQWKNGLYSVHPFKSLVDNRGYGKDATNCRQSYSRFRVDIQINGIPKVKETTKLLPNEIIIKELVKYQTISKRVYSKIRRILNI